MPVGNLPRVGERRERRTEPDAEGSESTTSTEPDPGPDGGDDPYAREAVIEQLTGPEDADD